MDTKNNKIFVTKTSMPPYEEYIEMIRPLWESRWITNMGDYHKQFEAELKTYLEASEISLCVNGHMALEMAIQSMGFQEGGEVITTPFTFISTTHAIVRNKLKPVFCDIKLDDYTIDESKIEELITEKTVAIVPVHVYGNICNFKEIERIAFKYNLKVIYDAAHAFGEKYQGVGVSNLGDASIFSFHATKVFNSVEGGAIAINSHSLYEKLYNLKNFGIRGEELVVDVGANAKMNEFSAAMGLCNLKYIDDNIKKRKNVVDCYLNHLSTCEDIVVPKYYDDTVEYNYGYFPVRFLSKGIRDLVYDTLRENEIYARKYFYPLTSDAACFKNKYKNIVLDNARYASDRILTLPLYPDLSNTDVDKICNIIIKLIKNIKKD